MPYPNAVLAGSTGSIDCSRVCCISGVSNRPSTRASTNTARSLAVEITEPAVQPHDGFILAPVVGQQRPVGGGLLLGRRQRRIGPTALLGVPYW